MIGASPEAIATAEDRERFKEAMTEIGLAVPESGFAYNLEDAIGVGERIGYPLIVRPSYILGGAGTGIAADLDELRHRGKPAWLPVPSPRSSSSGPSPDGRSSSSRS